MISLGSKESIICAAQLPSYVGNKLSYVLYTYSSSKPKPVVT